jgi:hypothetical protein
MLEPVLESVIHCRSNPFLPVPQPSHASRMAANDPFLSTSPIVGVHLLHILALINAVGVAIDRSGEKPAFQQDVPAAWSSPKQNKTGTR